MSWQNKYLQYIRGLNNYYQSDTRSWIKVRRSSGMNLGADKYKWTTPMLENDIASERARVHDETIEQLKRDKIISEEV
jgi:hypothetical protein